METDPFPAILCRDIEYSVITSDVIKSSDCINERTMRDCRRGYLQNLLISTATCLMRPIVLDCIDS